MGRQLLRLSHRNKASVEGIGQGWSENEAPRLDSKDQVDSPVSIPATEAIDCVAQTVLVLQERCDVVKEDSRFGKIGNLADQLFE
jgi:hypothetical protein